MNAPVTNLKGLPQSVTTGPIQGSRKVYASPAGRPDIRVPLREIALSYPLGYLSPLTAVPGVRWVSGVYVGVVLLAVGLSVAREIAPGRAFLCCLVVTGILLLALAQALPL